MVLPTGNNRSGPARGRQRPGGPTRRTMKAVRSVEGGVAVVDLDEPPGIGELLDMRATSICGSDLSYIRFGSRAILGHELAGVREDGTAGGRRGHLRLHGVPAVRSAAPTTCARPTASARSASAPTVAWPSSSVRRRPGWFPSRRGSTSVTRPLWSRRPSRGTRCGSPAPVRAPRVAVVGAGALGLLAVAGARRLGAEAVALEARHPYQKEAGERLGARIDADGVYDVVVEAAGTASEPGPRAASWSLRAGPSSSSACISGPSSWTGCRCSTKRPG